MAVTIEQAMDHLNADDDEKGKVQLALTHAIDAVNLMLYGNDKNIKADYNFYKRRESFADRAVLEMLANEYLHAAGDAKQNSTSLSSLDSFINYTREPSV